ncbi:small-subunit processome [Acaromyces ingoldii]|uniref:Small-subunit processome n=1 Tax=Acaromyces ingoldii TaxID=215250 RepID=A0A316YUF1_9BASI|nr:small-subunit processome [Acaromyces ingoldii]PWN92861.1 small-subunit processome [Acaromyces ingoldii]
MGQGGRKSNSQQAQARKERRAGGSGGPKSIHDVFEYATEQQEQGRKGRISRRGAPVATSGSEGEDSEEEGESKKIGPKSFLAGSDEGEEANPVDPDDDEEIDSDEAFGESDEEKFDGWRFGGGKNRGDEEEEEEEEDDEDMVDLSKMLDDNSDFGEDDEDNDEEDEGEEDSRLQEHMARFAEGGGKRSASQADLEGEEGESKRRVVLPERREALAEGAVGSVGGGQALSFEDLMQPFEGETGASLASLRKSAKTLAESQKKAKGGAASKSGGGALAAPLPSIIQDRIDRSAAYDETKGQVQGWQPTMKRLREAQHLSFPLQPAPKHVASTASMAAYFKPSNDMESTIASMIEDEGLTDKQLAEAEELKMNERGMSAEEIKRRRSELRQMRELLFRQEQKAKRVKKIKSKTYRKIARKQRQREGALAEELEGGAQGDEDDLEKRIEAERARAQERATLKHKNTGKWAQGLVGRRELQDMPEARSAVEEQLRKGEELRRRIHGRGSGSEDEEDDDDDDDDDDVSDAEAAHEKAFDELASLEKRDEARQARDEEKLDKKGKALWNMKFMKDARERSTRENRETLEELRNEYAGEDGAYQVASNPGRLAFGSSAPSAQKSQADDEQEEPTYGEDDDEERGEQVTSRRPKGPLKVVTEESTQATSTTRRLPPENAASSENPWLAGDRTMSKLSRKKNDIVVSKESSSQSKAANKLEKYRAKGQDARLEEEEESRLEIDPKAMLSMREREEDMTAHRAGSDDEVSTDSEREEEQPVLVTQQRRQGGRGSKAIQQRDLVAEAFAGDDVAAHFAAEKRAAIEADAPKEVDETLPGWGSWTGKGVSKKHKQQPKKKFVRQVAGLDESKRKDAKMANVIINERKDKKADKYRPKDVPFPYTSKAQYEMAMRNPLGPEWNTRTQHQRLTLPRVTTKPGQAIEPIKRLF